MEGVGKNNQLWAFLIIGLFTVLTVVSYSVNEYYIYL